MEIDVTDFVSNHDAEEYSASMAELGQNAGKITWANALNQAKTQAFLTIEAEFAEARKHFKEYGAWEAEEIAAWSHDDINALVVQQIAACVREFEHDDCIDADGNLMFDEFAAKRDGGNALYQGDDGKIYFYLGS